MTLKAVLDNLDGLDASVQALYTKGQDGKHYINVEGVVPADRLNEFRSNNIQLKKALEAFEGVDVDQYRKLVDQENKRKERKLIDAGDVDKVVEQRVAAMRTEYDGKLTESTKTIEALNGKLSSVLIDSAVKSASVATGVVPTAVDDVVLRAKATFQVKGADVVAVDAKGNVIYGKDGTTPLSIDEWVKDLKKSAPHLFEGMRGSGANGNRGGPGGITDTSKMNPTQKIAAGLSGQTH